MHSVETDQRCIAYLFQGLDPPFDTFVSLLTLERLKVQELVALKSGFLSESRRVFPARHQFG